MRKEREVSPLLEIGFDEHRPMFSSSRFRVFRFCSAVEFYQGFVKPKEAHHDADLYRLYHKAADDIERKGGKVLRVTLDYELKEKLYRKLGEAQARKDEHMVQSKQVFARELHLPIVQGKVSFPDMRIEYETQDGDRARVDLDLATGHYHAQHLAEKARAGFAIYARPEDAGGLRRVRDEREITTAIPATKVTSDHQRPALADVRFR